MEPPKVERIARLVKERDEMKSLIEWHQSKHFVFGDITISQNSPLHSQLIAVFENRLKYVESQLEAE
jgi:hypothetical protein